jgi:hypothetical protein
LKNLFRIMVLLLIFIELIWIFVSRDWAYFGQDMAAGWNGAGGVLSDEVYGIWSTSYSAVLLVVYFALYNYIKWAPKTFLILVCIDLATTPFLGISVFTGFDLLLYKLILICSGSVLGLAYFSELKNDFVRKVGGA